MGIFAARNNVPPHVDTLCDHLNDDVHYVRVEIAAEPYSATHDSKTEDVVNALIHSDERLIPHRAITY